MSTRVFLFLAIQSWVMSSLSGIASIMLYATGEGSAARMPLVFAVCGMLIGGVFMYMYKQREQESTDALLAILLENMEDPIEAPPPPLRSNYPKHPLFSEID